VLAIRLAILVNGAIPSAMARRRRPTRADRRRAEKEAANRLARERGAVAAEDAADVNRPRVARHVDQIDQLVTRREISADQAAAGMRFAGDFRRAGTATLGRLVGRYGPNLVAPPKRYQQPANDPIAAVQARARFEQACRELGPLAAVVIHTTVLDQAPEEWGASPTRRNGDALALLRLGLATLRLWYDQQLSELPAPPRATSEASAAPVATGPRSRLNGAAAPPT
jgi:hypothetical protein